MEKALPQQGYWSFYFLERGKEQIVKYSHWLKLSTNFVFCENIKVLAWLSKKVDETGQVTDAKL